MAKKYIDAEKLRAEIERRIEETKSMKPAFDQFWAGQISAFKGVIQLFDSLQQEQPDFPTTDEEVEKFLATHPKVEVPDKYKTPDWLFKKLEQEQPEVDLEKEYQEFCKDYPFPWSSQYVNREYIDELCLSVARHFYELGRLNARKEENKGGKNNE